ncbi:MAG TPA: hypothetical protein VGO50_03860 [Pyrinomonadaceae bacterium]|jgi:hypothetical protein|nr:hypothetical protein [Pyrinomonadaceae bacterium]
MLNLYRILTGSVFGVLTGAVVWGAIVRAIIFLLDLKHGEGFANIPSPFLGWLSVIIGGLDGAVIGAVLGYFSVDKVIKGALLAAATTLAIIFGYFFIIDPGISLLVSSSSLLAVRNLAVVAIILTVPSPFIGGITTLVCSRIWRWFEPEPGCSLSNYPRRDAKELVKPENRTENYPSD